MTDRLLLRPAAPLAPSTARSRARSHPECSLTYAARLAYGLAVLALPALGITVAEKVRPGGAAEMRQAAVPSLPSARTAAALRPVRTPVRVRQVALAGGAE